MVTTLECTEYAPAARLGRKEVERQAELITNTPLLSRHLDLIPDIILILNAHRQIVFANKAARTTLGSQSRERIFGKRPGEALNCVHADESDHGCGTTSFCRNCGAVNAILTGFKGLQDVQECHITRTDGGVPYDFRVTAAPYFFADERFIFFVIVDISNAKRREVLERIFFHDVNNTLNALMGSIELMPRHATRQENELAQGIKAGVYMLINEIGAQQSLLSAEDGNLVVQPETMSSKHFLHDVILLYSHYDCAVNRSIRIDDESTDLEFVSDRSQLSRIVGNMLKNALEASEESDPITAGCEQTETGRIRFRVHNPQYMERSVREQIFSRSFSTKGTGRGIGTYSMKLLGERYLRGSVSFTTAPEEGTTFMIDLPLFLTEH